MSLAGRTLALCLASTLSIPALGQTPRSTQKPYKDPTGIVAELQKDLRRSLAGGEVTFPIDVGAIIAILKSAGSELRKTEPLQILSVTNGFATIKGRRLPAAIVTAELFTMNRAEASYDSHKFYNAGVRDAEFDVWRAPLTVWLKDMDRDLENWKSAVSFEPSK